MVRLLLVTKNREITKYRGDRTKTRYPLSLANETNLVGMLGDPKQLLLQLAELRKRTHLLGWFFVGWPLVARCRRIWPFIDFRSRLRARRFADCSKVVDGDTQL